VRQAAAARQGWVDQQRRQLRVGALESKRSRVVGRCVAVLCQRWLGAEACGLLAARLCTQARLARVVVRLS